MLDIVIGALAASGLGLAGAVIFWLAVQVYGELDAYGGLVSALAVWGGVGLVAFITQASQRRR